MAADDLWKQQVILHEQPERDVRKSTLAHLKWLYTRRRRTSAVDLTSAGRALVALVASSSSTLTSNNRLGLKPLGPLGSVGRRPLLPRTGTRKEEWSGVTGANFQRQLQLAVQPAEFRSFLLSRSYWMFQPMERPTRRAIRADGADQRRDSTYKTAAIDVPSAYHPQMDLSGQAQGVWGSAALWAGGQGQAMKFPDLVLVQLTCYWIEAF
ncbi:hypothetical protein DL98DRAFT_573552 [Cadophora sp. DSE1049]|nr:hypothetical protein DL98DRAFT_573552 [Cadophora sp. DSE1049]